MRLASARGRANPCTPRVCSRVVSAYGRTLREFESPPLRLERRGLPLVERTGLTEAGGRAGPAAGQRVLLGRAEYGVVSPIAVRDPS